MDTKTQTPTTSPKNLQDEILVGLLMASFTTREMVEHYESKGASGDYWMLKRQMEQKIRDWIVKYKAGVLSM